MPESKIDILQSHQTTTCHICFKTDVDIYPHWTLVMKNNPERYISPFVELQSKKVVNGKTTSQTDSRAPQMQKKICIYNSQFWAVSNFQKKI